MKAEVQNLTVVYRDGDHALLALDRVNLNLSPGEVTALVGESGSGKTTLGKALIGLLPDNAQVEGSIRLGGQEVIGRGEAVLNQLRWSKAAMVFQNGAANLNPVHRVIDQVAEPLIQLRGVDRKNAVREAEKRVAEMGLASETARRYPHELSGGQAQRALLAMALILDPELLILDEPTSALDARTKMFIAGVIRRLRSRRKAVLLITHDLGLAGDLADDLAVLYLGQIMELMPASDLLNHPRHPYTWALARSYPGMDAFRDLGGIRGDAFFRLVHAHSGARGPDHIHTHVDAPGAVHQDGHAPPQGCLFEPRCTQSIQECRLGEIGMTPAGEHQVRCLRGGIVNLIELHGIEKAYGKIKAVRATDLSLQAGEVFCLVGETGSGKTTLATIAAGALTPDKGSRVFEGRDMDAWIKHDYKTLAPRIGLIHQNPEDAVSHRFSVFDIIAEPLRIQDGRYTKDEIRRLVLQALSDVHLSTSREFLGKYPHELNSGAIQRLCMARALIHDPVLLIADEPTSSLDPSVQAKVLKMLLELQIEKGLTMLFVTHDIGLARKIGDRIGVMLEGEIVEEGPAARILENPEHPYTALLIAGAKGLAEPEER
ncbi:MAG: ABC transporter ATP-binding protein, partial [Desulfobacteraceae bacterium]